METLKDKNRLDYILQKLNNQSWSFGTEWGDEIRYTVSFNGDKVTKKTTSPMERDYF